MELRQIVYASRPHPRVSLSDVDAIVAASQAWNAARGITGRLLVVVDASDAILAFMQWIEGPPLAIEACLKRIAADPRHREIRIVQDAFVDERSYPEWSMAREVVAPDRVASALAAVGQAGHLAPDGELLLESDGDVADGDDLA